jgi:hypothetical protein
VAIRNRHRQLSPKYVETRTDPDQNTEKLKTSGWFLKYRFNILALVKICSGLHLIYVLHHELLLEGGHDAPQELEGGGRENDVVDVEEEVRRV